MAVSSFTAPLELTPDLDRDCYRTVREFGFDVGFKGSGLRITVPAGFLTDLMSGPRWLWWLFPRDDPRYAAAVVVHDYLYKWKSERGEKFDRATADAIFLEAMLILGVPEWKAVTMYVAVRLFGEGP